MKRNLLLTLGVLLSNPINSSYNYGISENCNKTLGVALIEKDENIEEIIKVAGVNETNGMKKSLLIFYESSRVLIIVLAALMAILSVINYSTDTHHEEVNSQCIIGLHTFLANIYNIYYNLPLMEISTYNCCENYTCSNIDPIVDINTQDALGLIVQLILSIMTILFTLFDGVKKAFTSCSKVCDSMWAYISSMVGKSSMTGGKLWMALGEILLGIMIILGYGLQQKIFMGLASNTQTNSLGMGIGILCIIQAFMLFTVSMVECIFIK